MDILGDSLQKIAFEKAGIIKENVPVVIGETNAETRPVFEKKASEMNAPVLFAEKKYRVISSEYSAEFLKLRIHNNESNRDQNLRLDLNGLYQEKNILSVLAAIDFLKNSFQLKDEKIIEALAEVKKLTGLFGRWQIIHENPTVVLDVAHNEDGIKQLLLHLQKLNYQSLHIIFGMVKDKDIRKVLCQFPREATFYFTKAHNPRALPEDQLQQMAKEFELKGATFDNVNQALKSALDHASSHDIIVVCGSVFVIAEVESL